jgi:carboxymethylenebutenolidase
MPEITTRRETVTSADGQSFDAYLSVPRVESGPGVLLLQEIFGVNDFLKAKADELAAAGYVVMCPDVFWRVKPNVSLAHDEASMQEAFGYMQRYAAEVDESTQVTDLVSAFEHLKSLPETSKHDVGVMGYCLGGYLAYLTAAATDAKTCVAYYGSGIASRLDLAADLTCPVLFHFGGADPYIPSDQIGEIVHTFSGREDVRIRIEPEAGHAFENLMAEQFANPEAASRSFPATLEWLHQHLS